MHKGGLFTPLDVYVNDIVKSSRNLNTAICNIRFAYFAYRYFFFIAVDKGLAHMLKYEKTEGFAMNSSEHNAEIARSLEFFDKTIAVLRLGADEKSVLRLESLLCDLGFYVYEITPEKFASDGGEKIGSITVICDGASVPKSLEEPLERYLTQNGRLFIFGGPLFGLDNITEKAPVIEGICPLYKTFAQEKCESFETLENAVTDATLHGNAARTICPNARPIGEGFDMGRRCRFLPLVSVKNGDDGARDGGKSGAAAFFMLSDTIGHMVFTPGTRLGNVSPITIGSEVGVIGVPLSDALTMGGEKLIADMTEALSRGIFLFEAGTSRYVLRPYEKIELGAKIISASRDFEEVTVRFKVGETIEEHTALTTGQNFTSVKTVFGGLGEGEYEVVTELIKDGKVIDRVKQELFVTHGNHSQNKYDFIRVEDGNFRLGEKNWYLYGINYFPLYQISLELNDYWRSAFDRSNYIPSEVEKDLSHIKMLGLNTVSIRVDCNSLENLTDPLRDFFYRCKRLGLRVMMSFCNITNPLYFNEKAFAKLVRDLGIADDPTLIAHDIFWESGGGFARPVNARHFAPEWRAWLIDTYGSYERAEKSFGEPLDRTETGDVICPHSDNYVKRIAEKRVKMTAFTRFLTDMTSSRWRDAISKMKKYDSNHLYTNRIGHLDDNVPNVFLSPASKHLDFMCLEAYSFTLDDMGYYASAALDRAAHYVSGGKPVTWVEYGISLPGMSGLAVGTKLLWDGEKNQPLEWRLEEQRQYQAQFNRLFGFCASKGSMPWFYPGGFRFTEHSDCGYVAQNGSLRPAFREYLKSGDFFSSGKGKREEKKITEYAHVDPEGELSYWCKFVYGEGVFSKFDFDRARLLYGKQLEDNRVAGAGIRAAKSAEKNGGLFEFVTDGDGTTSANTPLVLCGNAAFEGYGPLKYLDGEFNYVKFVSADGREYAAENGGELRLDVGIYTVEVGVGNLAAATWLSGSCDGDVMLKVGKKYIPLEKDVRYLSDGVARGEYSVAFAEEIELRLSARGRADFGEIFRISIKI